MQAPRLLVLPMPRDVALATRVSPYRRTVAATPLQVRIALEEMCAVMAEAGIADGIAAAAEQVMAEVLNNVVEHALAGRPNGLIEIEAEPAEGGMAFSIRDDGAPMPDGKAPDARILPPKHVLGTLPEGGFGWNLIRTLSTEVSYQRQDGWNILRLKVLSPI